MKIIKYASLFILIGLNSCSQSKKNDEKEASKKSVEMEVQLNDTQIKNAGITTTFLQQQNIETSIQLNGRIDVPPQNLVSVSVPLGGYLKSTKLLPGMHVSKGEVIAVMQDQQYIQLQQDFLLTQSKLHFSEIELARQTNLAATQSTSDKQLQAVQAEVNQLKINAIALGEKLKLININPAKLNSNNISKEINIYSNIDGYVNNVHVNIGKYVNASDVLFELINPTDIHLNLKVFEKDIPNIFIGQQVSAFTNNDPQKKYTCEVILINKNVNEQGVTEVHCHFENYSKLLLPGMYMNAIAKINSKNSYTLPISSIVRFEGKDYVFIEEKKGIYSLNFVEVGVKQESFAAINNYKNFEGKKVVSNGAYTLLMKLKNIEEE
ncbi:MAG: efflux RND transporter periplasmic adaptor subunit [Chitinophagaceae bacterium]